MTEPVRPLERVGVTLGETLLKISNQLKTIATTVVPEQPARTSVAEDMVRRVFPWMRTQPPTQPQQPELISRAQDAPRR